MTRKIIYLILAALPAVACTHKKLCLDDHLTRSGIKVIVHWEDNAAKPPKGMMMLNLFSLNDSPRYGMAQIPCDGDVIQLVDGSSYCCLCYDYYAENIYFRNEYDNDAIEAYCAPLVRATYSRVNPNEHTVAEPEFPFWLDCNSNFPVKGDDLHFYPENAVEVFTFEIRGVVGAQYITATRGGIGGMWGSYFLSSGTAGTPNATVLFNAAKDGANNKITGSFCTFKGARLTQTNKFTIEILYPSKANGIIYASWDVTQQVCDALHVAGIPDIIIENNNDIPPIIPEDDDQGSGFEPDVREWNDEYVPIPM